MTFLRVNALLLLLLLLHYWHALDYDQHFNDLLQHEHIPNERLLNNCLDVHCMALVAFAV
jgi:hypothetical protein